MGSIFRYMTLAGCAAARVYLAQDSHPSDEVHEPVVAPTQTTRAVDPSLPENERLSLHAAEAEPMFLQVAVPLPNCAAVARCP